MAESLLDIGALTNQALNLARMSQMEERADMQAQRLDFARKKQAQDVSMDRIANLTKHAENELLPTDVRVKIAGHALREMDPSLNFSDEELSTGWRSVAKASKLAIDPNVSLDEKLDAWGDAAVRVPNLAKKLMDISEKAGAADEKRHKVLNELALQDLKIRDLNAKQNNIELRNGVYSTAGGFLNQLTDSVNVTDADKKRSFTPVFNKLLNAKDDIEKKILLSGVRDLDDQFKTKIHGIQQAATMQFAQWRNELEPLKGAVEQAKAEGREVDKDDLEKVAALELVGKAEADLSAWVGNPYDKKNWNRLQTTLQQVKMAQGATKKELSGLDGVRQGMLENSIRKVDLEYGKEQTKQQGIEHLATIQQQFGELPDEEQTVQKAAGLIKTSGFKDVAVDDVLKANPTKFKRASTEVNINQNSPGERKDIAEGRSKLDMIDNIKALYSPNFVGPVDTRMGRIKSLTGTIKEQEAEFRSGVKLMRAELRKFYFGTAQSKQELTGALEAIPDLDMSDPQFTASLKQTERNVNSMLSRRIETMEQSNVKAPKGKPMKDRYKELEQSGKSKDAIFQQLDEEGY